MGAPFQESNGDPALSRRVGALHAMFALHKLDLFREQLLTLLAERCHLRIEPDRERLLRSQFGGYLFRGSLVWWRRLNLVDLLFRPDWTQPLESFASRYTCTDEPLGLLSLIHI